MRLILDSNIYCRDFSLAGTSFQTFLSELLRTGNSLFVPEIIIEEVVNSYFKEYKILRTIAARIGFVSYQHLPNLNEQKRRYQTDLLEKLSRIHYSPLGYPNTPHGVLARKALEHKKPFKPNGQGYRDSLIWANVLELAGSGDHSAVGFISSNVRDFAAENDTSQLHPDLLEDIRRTSQVGSIGEIRFFASLELFVHEHIIPSLQILTEIESSLRSNTYENLNLTSFVEDELNDFALGREFSNEEINLPDEVTSANFSCLNAVLGIEEVAAMKISDNELLIDFSVKADCEFDFYVHRAFAQYYFDNIRLRSDFDDEDKDWVPASISTGTIIDIAIIYNTESRLITSKQILSARPLEAER
jgi:hypothetical protein